MQSIVLYILLCHIWTVFFNQMVSMEFSFIEEPDFAACMSGLWGIYEKTNLLVLYTGLY